MFYTLTKDFQVVACDASEMAKLSFKDKVVEQTQIGNIKVSTVFIGIDIGLRLGKPPIVFETMIFVDDNDEESYVDRYATYADAKRGHKKAILEAHKMNPRFDILK